MGLFKKKVCDICGGEIGLLGNRKLDDGNCCKDCASRLSPFMTDRRRTSVQDIRAQLAYREANFEALNSFNPTVVLGSNFTKIYIDENYGAFCVSNRSDWRRWNPDLIPFDQVADVRTNIHEYRSEMMDHAPDGRRVPFDPPRFEYSYDFDMILLINSPWFDEIRFELTDQRPDSPFSSQYQYYVSQSDEIRRWLLGDRYFPETLPQFNPPVWHPAPRPIHPQPAPAPMPHGGVHHEPPASPMGHAPQGGVNRAPQGQPPRAPQQAPHAPQQNVGRAPQGGQQQAPGRQQPQGGQQPMNRAPQGGQPQNAGRTPQGGQPQGAGGSFRTQQAPQQNAGRAPQGGQPQQGAGRAPQGGQPQRGPQGGPNRGPQGGPGRR